MIPHTNRHTISCKRTHSTGRLPVELNMKKVPQDMYRYSTSPPPVPPHSDEMLEDVTSPVKSKSPPLIPPYSDDMLEECTGSWNTPPPSRPPKP